MAIIESLEIDPTQGAIIGSYRAPEVGDSGGYYRSTLLSGTIASIAAGGMFYAFRNPSSNLVLVHNVSVGFRAVAGGAVPISQIVSMYVTRSYTVLDTTGAATALSYKGQLLAQTKTSQMNSIQRISNTGAMSGGTGTDDAHPINSLIFTHPGIISTLGNYPMFQQNPGGLVMPTHPLVLNTNEGFRLRFDNAMLAADTMVAFVDVEWLECSAF